MILFHPLQNRAMQFSLQLLARLRYMPLIDGKEIEALGQQFYLDPLYLETVLKTLEDSGIVSLEKQNGKTVGCSRCQTAEGNYILPRLPAGRLEREYLQYILRLPEAELFLPEALRQQLLQPPAAWLEQIQRIAPTEINQARPVEPETFQRILQAIREKRAIRYCYRDKEHEQYVQTQAVPWKLEYSAYDKRWWIILYEPEQKRTVKAVLGNLRQVTLGTKHGLSEQVIREAIDGLCLKDTPVVLRVENIRGALQRCFLLFENQEFIHTQMQDERTFLLSFRYYRFDTEEILRKLMQLGPAVTLLEPASLKQALRKRLTEALKRTELT